MSRAIIRRWCIVLRAGGGSAMPTLGMSGGIRACCRLEKKVARHRASSDRFDRIPGSEKREIFSCEASGGKGGKCRLKLPRFMQVSHIFLKTDSGTIAKATRRTTSRLFK